jgi:hypothetical protein
VTDKDRIVAYGPCPAVVRPAPAPERQPFLLALLRALAGRQAEDREAGG